MLFSKMNIRKGRVVTKDGSNEITYQGIQIVIENDIGSTRAHKNGETKMFYPYGYIKGTKGIDNEEVDCFIGNEPYAANVYIIKLAKADREEKIFFGFTNQEAARDAFLAHYDDQSFLGEIIEMPIDLFKSTLEWI